MARLLRSSALFLSCCPTALEILRLLILSGLNTIQLLHEGTAVVREEDIIQCFWLQNEDLGKPRATAVAARVVAQYPSVRCEVLESIMAAEDLACTSTHLPPSVSVVIAVNLFQQPMDTRSAFFALHARLRATGTLFLYVRCVAWVASITVDFGDAWICDTPSQQGDVPPAAVTHAVLVPAAVENEGSRSNTLSLTCSVDEDALPSYLQASHHEIHLRSPGRSPYCIQKADQITRLSASSLAVKAALKEAPDFVANFQRNDQWLLSLVPVKETRTFRSLPLSLAHHLQSPSHHPDRIASLDKFQRECVDGVGDLAIP